ncbi:MAG: cell surface protein [Opitutales bacterium]
MHKTPFTHASRIFAVIAAALALLTFSGCTSLRITNLTPETVPANPSQIYTITASVRDDNPNIVPDSTRMRIVIDGQNYPMTKSIVGGDIWEFDYQLPAGRTNASYYFLVSYSLRTGNGEVPAEVQSETVQTMNIAGRYVIRPEANRAPVGSRVSVLGAGFTPGDVVYFDFTPTRTVFESPSSLSFFVPAVDPGKSYRLRLTGGGTELQVGSFRVDALNFSISPTSLTLRTGEQQALTFTIPQPAPAGGMLIDVTTDAPESIVMPEVMVAAGQTSVTVPVQGGKPGSGSLFFKSSAGESTVSVTVTAR